MSQEIGNILLIAEVKTKSPFGFASDKTWDELLCIANRYGDIISIHTDPRWGGSLELIKKARALTQKPILAKGIHTTDTEVKNALHAGADYVLVVGRIPKVHREKLFIEPLSFDEIVATPKDVRLVWNSRDLLAGGTKKETIADVRKIWTGWLCQASFIQRIDQIHPTVQAVLVGEHLFEFVKTME